MRNEVKEIISQSNVIEELQFGKYEGDDFIVVRSYDTIEAIEKLLNESGIEHDGAENELGEHGYEEDYYHCSDCFEFIYVAPKYNGQPNDYITVGHDCIDYLCLNCAHNHKAEYLEKHINNYNNALMENGVITENDLKELGFNNKGSYSAGWNYGTSDSPENLYNRLNTQFNDIVFMINDYNPFDTHYTVWTR